VWLAAAQLCAVSFNHDMQVQDELEAMMPNRQVARILLVSQWHCIASIHSSVLRVHGNLALVFHMLCVSLAGAE
jgi:hypothetical protein